MDSPNFRFRHVGINTENENEAKLVAKQLAVLFQQSMRSTAQSELVGSGIEVMHEKGHGTYGHIAFTVDSVEAAAEHLAQMGSPLDMSTAVYGSDGKIKLVYAKNEIAGFALHIFKEPKKQ